LAPGKRKEPTHDCRTIDTSELTEEAQRVLAGFELYAEIHAVVGRTLQRKESDDLGGFMAQVLIVYGTSYGQTERISQRLARALERSGHSVTPRRGDLRSDDLRLETFDAVVIAASVIRGRHQRYIRKFARSNATALNRLPTAFVSVCGAAQDSPEAARKYVDGFLHETGLQPDLVRSFAGAITYTRYGPVTRWIMRRITRSKGGPVDTSRDHEMTDWDEVERFAAELSRKLVRSPGWQPGSLTVR
jgi:menaquinone-dependent protoporphyrinogen oxidase